ncbi:MAG: hypothetical protein CMN74_01595 [Sphingorhabdus sp.]|nr:hypothetical protein [Sphingorhabdus sp.]
MSARAGHAKRLGMANPPSKNPVAGGFFIAAGLLIGAIIGIFRGQSSLYMIGGLLIGGAIALAIWLVDRSKR